MRTEKFEQAAADLKIPVLLIRGKLSDVVSPEGVRHFLETVPNAEFVELSDAGHTAAGDDNDAFSDVVVTFVDALPAGAVSRPVSRRDRRTACASPTAPCWRSRRGCARRSGTAARW